MRLFFSIEFIATALSIIGGAIAIHQLQSEIAQRRSESKKGFFDVDLRELKERPYSLHAASAADIDWIFNKSRELHGDEASPRKRRLSWHKKNPHGIWIIRNKEGATTGSIEIFPVTKNYIDKIISGCIHEKDKSDKDICGVGAPYHCLYIESVIAVDENNAGHPWVVREMMMKVPSVLTEHFPDWKSKFIYNQTVSEYRTKIGKRRSNASQILEKIGFNKIGRNSLQGLDIYRAIGSDVSKRIDDVFFSDKSSEVTCADVEAS